MGGTSKCIGILEMKHQGEWRPVDGWSDWNLQSSSVVCRQLDCGSAVSTEWRSDSTHQPGWMIESSCLSSETSLRECGATFSSTSISFSLEVICSGNNDFNNDIDYVDGFSCLTFSQLLIYINNSKMITITVYHRLIRNERCLCVCLYI